jgi:hypothetical protein
MIDAEIHEAVMALPPDERRDRTKVNEAVAMASGLARCVLPGVRTYTAFPRGRSSATLTSRETKRPTAN